MTEEIRKNEKKKSGSGRVGKSLLSRRLRLIADFVTPGNRVADIGTDHGFLPVELVKNGICPAGIASDIGKGPIERAREHVREAGETVASKIDVRLGPGLGTLKKGEADTIVIAGMGGLLIRDILSENAEIAADAKELVLSPHTEIPEVRRYLTENRLRIEREEMVYEEGKYYTVIKAVPGETKLTERELRFGPVLLKERPQVFEEYLTFRLRKTEAILKKLSREKETEDIRAARDEKEKEAREIREILGNSE